MDLLFYVYRLIFIRPDNRLITHRAATRSSDYSPSKAAVLAAQSIVPEPHATETSIATSAEREATGTLGEPVETDRCFNPAFSCKPSIDTGDAGLTRRELEGRRLRLTAAPLLTSSFYSADKERREVHSLWFSPVPPSYLKRHLKDKRTKKRLLLYISQTETTYPTTNVSLV